MSNKPLRFWVPLVLAGLVYLSLSCEKDNPRLVSPAIQLLEGPDRISGDTLLEAGQKASLLIRAQSEGSAITLFNIRIYTDGQLVSVDSGVNTEQFEATIHLAKGLAETERWVFRVRNADMQWDSLSIIVGLKTGQIWGPVLRLNDLMLGAQENPGGSFLSLSNGQIFLTDSAWFHQEAIDLCYYFDPSGDLNTLASPGANISDGLFPGSHPLSSWTVRNEARFMELSLPDSLFYSAGNDSLILATSFVYQTGKRKAKLLQPGMKFSFIRGPYSGIFLVKQVQGQAEGMIKMDLLYRTSTRFP